MVKKIKVLFVTSKSLGGSGKYIYNLVKGVQGFDIECDLVYYRENAGQDGEIESVFQRVFYLPMKPSLSPFSNIINIFALAYLIRGGGYNVVHTHTSIGGFIGRLGNILSFRAAVSVHTIHAFGADENVQNPQKWIYSIIEKGLNLITDQYVSPSKYIKEYGIRAGLITGVKTQVIYNSIDFKLPIDTYNRREIRSSMGIDSQEIVFLFCGRIEEQKGLDVLIKALGNMPADIKWKAVVCGDGSLAQEARKIAENLNCIHKIIWVGWVDHVDPFYCVSDIFVLPTRWESFGLVFLEAMRYNLPIVSTRTQAVPEVVQENINGLLFNKDDVNGLTETLVRICRDNVLRQSLGRNSKTVLDSNFDYRKFISNHTLMYRRVVGWGV